MSRSRSHVGSWAVGKRAARAGRVGRDAWYGSEHHHSALKFVTPRQRHRGDDIARLARRDARHQAASAANPAHWSGPTRHWQPAASVSLNPGRTPSQNDQIDAVAA